jgi:hypothetical protein
MPDASFKNEEFVLYKDVKYERKKTRGKLKRQMEPTHVPISLDKNKDIGLDDFYRNGGTYKSHMNKRTSYIDSSLIERNKNLITEYTQREIHDHHKTILLGDNYREIYNTDFKPQRNPLVTNTQTVNSKTDMLDPMNPQRVGYQYI